MKQGFIGSLVKRFIIEKDFLPVMDESGEIFFEPGVGIIIKNSYGTMTAVELVDADILTCEEIKLRLERNAEKLFQLENASTFFFFEVFIFNSEPDSEKLRVINEGQVHESMGKRFLKCLSVNMASVTIDRHFKTPLTDMGIGKLVKKQLKTGAAEGIGKEEIHEILREKEKDLKIEFKAKTSFITIALIAINILVWAAINLYSLKSGISYSNLLIEFGAKENMSIINGQYWRLLTPIFLHADIVHLMINCYSLYAVGISVERLYGHPKFFAVYFVAGIIGNIASFMFSTSPGVGASGSIFGLMGALLYLGLERPAFFKAYMGYNVIATIVINLVYGFSNAGIDNFAHIGGLVGGFLATGSLSTSLKKNWYLNRGMLVFITLAIAFAGMAYGLTNKQNRILPMVQQLQQFDREQKWSEAEKIAEEILAQKPGNESINTSILWTLTKAEAISGKFDEAAEHGKQLSETDPKNGHYLLGLIYFDMKQYADARTELLEAKRLNAPYSNIDDLLGQIDKLVK